MSLFSAMSQAKLRTELRALLYDDLPPLVWQNDTLDLCLREAWAEHAALFPWHTALQIALVQGQTAYPLEAVINGNGSQPTDGLLLADIIQITHAEWPKRKRLPFDPQALPNPAGTVVRHTTQGWWTKGTDLLFLTNPPTAHDLTVGPIWLYLAQTWVRPCDEVGATWNGPTMDVDLLYLLAKRYAYQLLQEWQARNQYVTPGDPVTKLSTVGVLQSLTTQINAAIKARRARLGRSAVLEVV